MLPADLPRAWLKLAEQQERLRADAQATILRFCAEELTQALAKENHEALTLQQAADESGYSPDHLGRLVREGKIPNAGRPNAPRIARRDLPQKAGVEAPRSRHHLSRQQIVRSAIGKED